MGAAGEPPPAGAAAQARRCLEIIEAALREVDATLADVVRTRIYLADPADLSAVAEVFAEARPACTVVSARLLDEQWRVEIEAEAVVGD